MHATLTLSAQAFSLRMTRRGISSYLGLTLETVNRTLSAPDAAELIPVDQRSIKILKPEALRDLPHTNVSKHAHTKTCGLNVEAESRNRRLVSENHTIHADTIV